MNFLHRVKIRFPRNNDKFIKKVKEGPRHWHVKIHDKKFKVIFDNYGRFWVAQFAEKKIQSDLHVFVNELGREIKF